jgi:16S rRNA (uracil1498-N3)-methyltransferase
MHRFYLPPEQSGGQALFLSGDEAHHAHHVLRLLPGQVVEVLNGAGEIVTCEVRSSNRSSLELAVLARKARDPLPCSVTLIQAIPKGKLFEDIVEKATELGVSCIVPLISERVISRPEGDDAMRKTAKWKRTAIETLKQCGSAWLPTIQPPVALADYLSRREHAELPFLASLQPDAREMRECVTRFLNAQQRPPRSASLWIGPEGDFSLGEIEQINRETGAQPISLGPWVLRTDTATIASLALLNHEIRTARQPARERT